MTKRRELAVLQSLPLLEQMKFTYNSHIVITQSITCRPESAGGTNGN